jgi:hypothetical protein
VFNPGGASFLDQNVDDVTIAGFRVDEGRKARVGGRRFRAGHFLITDFVARESVLAVNHS